MIKNIVIAFLVALLAVFCLIFYGTLKWESEVAYQNCVNSASIFYSETNVKDFMEPIIAEKCIDLNSCLLVCEEVDDDFNMDKECSKECSKQFEQAVKAEMFKILM